MSQKKNTMLHIRISTDDLERVKDHAAKLGLPTSQFCLKVILAALEGEELDIDSVDNILTRLSALEREVFSKSSSESIAA